MKKNGNNLEVKDYYVGFDIGTNSIGLAVTDTEYVLKRFKGSSMWSVRLFEEGNTAEERRLNRTNRRRYARKKQRLELLRMLFDEEISKIDPGFFMRLKESSLYEDEKKSDTKYSIFADKDFTDKDYIKKYPTVYHLRNELIKSSEPHDIRLVYLALHHIMKARGHFLFDIGDASGDGIGFNDAINTLKESALELLDIEITISDLDKLHETLLRKDMTRSDKQKEVIKYVSAVSADEESDEKFVKKASEKLFSFICGLSVNLKDIFYKEESTELRLTTSGSEEDYMKAAAEYPDLIEVITAAKSVYDTILLEGITGEAQYVSEYKINEYEQHKSDIRYLKDYIRNVLKDDALYKEMFVKKEKGLNNYSAYSGYKKAGKIESCKADDFYAYLKKRIPAPEANTAQEYKDMYGRISEGTFAPKLRSSENGVIPSGLHRKELCAILDNATKYLQFLNDAGNDGISAADKIKSIFDFKIPYYVGPLNNSSERSWVVRKDEKIYPWNFEDIVDLKASAAGFIERMTSQCTYTGEDVLPKDSLLFREFTVLNEINNIKVNGNPIPIDCKKQIYDELFVKSSRKVTLKSIKSFLLREGQIKQEDTVSGVNETLTSSLSSYHKMRNIISKTSYDTAEEIIRQSVLFGDEKKLLKEWLKEHTNLIEEDIAYVLKLKFKEWGSLSKTLLSEIKHTDIETGEIYSVIERMRDTNENLMQLLSSKYTFLAAAEEHKKEKLGIIGSPRKAIDELYVSPKIRRSIWQAYRMVDEIVDIEKAAPKKIFIEVARDKDGSNPKNATKSRKDRLLELYKSCKKESGELFAALSAEDESKLRSDKLFLYYSQFGKCMYSGEVIDIEKLGDNGVYDIDHIFPRSKIKDDSLDNRVLVKADLNRAKTDDYPISSDIRNKMYSFWKSLKDKDLISQKKFDRLTRSTGLTDEELSSFVNRQLVETRQSSKAVAELLKEIYPNTRIIYSKAANVDEFKQHFGFIKCREVNDLHHAKDAYLNIVVGNYFDTRFTEQFFKNIKSENYSLNPKAMYRYTVKGAWNPADSGTIATVRKMMSKNNVLYTRQPTEYSGQLFKENILQAGKGQVFIKDGKDITRYGGYNSAFRAYFALVEHEKKGKLVRTIESVPLYKRASYEVNPTEFAKAEWYPNAHIIIPKILFDSLFEIDGVRMHISKSSGKQIGFKHASQLLIDDNMTAKLKTLLNYTERCRIAKSELALTLHEKNDISTENNILLYDLFMDKLRTNAYGNILSTMLSHMERARDSFIDMTLLTQCNTIAEILKAFKCNAQRSSFEELCGVKEVGVILKNMKISDFDSIYLINQSPTGLYETKIDLLK